MRIAIIGTGVSGLVAAHQLRHDHELTVFEADARLGGHANTVDIEVDGVQHAVDTGFIVYNEANYPGFVSLLDELDVATHATEMSFSVADARSGLEYRGSNLNTLFAQRRNLVNPRFLRLVTEIVRFNRAARRLVENETRWHGADRLSTPATEPDDESIVDFLRRGRYSTAFEEQFLIPFGAAIWSADPSTFTQFPMRSYARFMHNHGLLGVAGRPQWRTITGGSRRYIDALTAPLARPHPPLLPRAQDRRPRRWGGRGADRPRPRVVRPGRHRRPQQPGVARCSVTRPMPSATVLGAIRYQPNLATLHTDGSVLPTRHRARASWNYWVDPGEHRATVTYWMNSLQGIDSTQPVLVTLNRADAIDPARVLAEIEYDHPVFDAAAMQAQRRRHEIQGTRGIYFAGAYWGYGFHEDGVQSGLEVARAIQVGP